MTARARLEINYAGAKYMPIRLKATLMRFGIKQNDWCAAVIQTNGYKLSLAAGAQIINWDTWPKTTQQQSIKTQTEDFLRSRGIPDAEIADLKAGRLDLLMASGIQISDWLKTSEGKDFEIKVKLLHDKIFGYGDGAGLRKEDNELRERLNAAIKAVRASGKYQEITARYFDFDIYE